MFQSSDNTAFLLSALLEGSRIDGRGLLEMRGIELVFGDQFGQVQLSLGTTTVLATVGSEIVEPRPGRPGEGFLRFEVKMGEMGEPQQAALSGQEGQIEQVLERVLVKSGAVDVEGFCLLMGRFVWSLQVRMVVMDNCGNALDACVLAAFAALRFHRQAEVEIEGGVCRVYSPEDRPPHPLSFHHTPLSFTYGLLEGGSRLLLDPSILEEKVTEGFLTVALNENDEVCLVDKAGMPMEHKRLLAAIHQLRERSKSLVKTIDGEIEKQLQDRLRGRTRNWAHDWMEKQLEAKLGAASGQSEEGEEPPHKLQRTE